jgi:hypothetical protein
MSIETRETPTPGGEETGEGLNGRVLVEQITVDMLLMDLEAGRSRAMIAKRYSYKDPVDGEIKSLQTWMVNKMFEDPKLKGKKPARVKKLPFAFEGSSDTTTTEEEIVDTVQGTEALTTDQTIQIG